MRHRDSILRVTLRPVQCYDVNMTVHPISLKRRPLSADVIPIPADVKLNGRWLMWRFERKSSARTPPPDLLRDFLKRFDYGRLSPPEAANQALLFARKWGPLHLCACGLPVTHRRYGEGDACLQRPPQEKGYDGELWSGWLKFARQLTTALRIAEAIHAKKAGPIGHADWKELYATVPNWTWTWSVPPQGKDRGRDTLLVILSAWMREALLRPSVWWELRREDRASGGFQIGFASGEGSFGGLYGSILMQLVLAVTRSPGIAFCAGCNNLVFIERQTAQGTRRYCDRCRKKGVPLRDAARNHRARLRAGEFR